jgi:hypothetical protein
MTSRVDLAEALRSWPDATLRDFADEPAPLMSDFREAAERELARRAKPCTCYLGERPRRDCPRPQGWRP